MAQGKPYTPEQRKEILERLKPYFQLGYNRYRACISAKFDPSLLGKWEKKDPELAKKIDAWQNSVNTVARKNLAQAIEGGDINTSQYWLEKRDKDFIHKQQLIVDNSEQKETLSDAFKKLAQRKNKPKNKKAKDN